MLILAVAMMIFSIIYHGKTGQTDDSSAEPRGLLLAHLHEDVHLLLLSTVDARVLSGV